MGNLELLDFLVKKIGCDFVSNLRYLSKAEKHILSVFIQDFTDSDDYSVEEWNEALDYIFDLPKQQSSEEAREIIISILSKA